MTMPLASVPRDSIFDTETTGLPSPHVENGQLSVSNIRDEPFKGSTAPFIIYRLNHTVNKLSIPVKSYISKVPFIPPLSFFNDSGLTRKLLRLLLPELLPELQESYGLPYLTHKISM
jgi:hypothetical protein